MFPGDVGFELLNRKRADSPVCEIIDRGATALTRPKMQWIDVMSIDETPPNFAINLSKIKTANLTYAPNCLFAFATILASRFVVSFCMRSLSPSKTYSSIMLSKMGFRLTVLCLLLSFP